MPRLTRCACVRLFAVIAVSAVATAAVVMFALPGHTRGFSARRDLARDLTECNGAQDALRVTCQRSVIAVYGLRPATSFLALADASDSTAEAATAEAGTPGCDGVARELGRQHWRVDHRLPIYHPVIAACNGAFIGGVLAAVVEGTDAEAAFDEGQRWCSGDPACWETFGAAFTAAGPGLDVDSVVHEWCSRLGEPDAKRCRDGAEHTMAGADR